MSLADLASLSQLVAAVAVIASLIYAALQFRIYAASWRDSRVVAALGDLQEFRKLIAMDADCARIYRDGLADMGKLDSIEQWRFGALMQLLVTNFSLYEEFSEQFGDEDHGNIRRIVRRPGFQQWWPAGRVVLPRKTVAFIERVMKEEGALQPAPATPVAAPPPQPL